MKLISESSGELVGHIGDLTVQDPPVNGIAVVAQMEGAKVTPKTLIYSAAAPSYEAIFGAAAKGAGVKTNLMSHFVCMDPSPEAFGEVLTRSEIANRF